MSTPVCDQPNDQRSPSIAPDGSGGAFIGWLDYRVGHQIPVLYAMRLDGAGDFASGWPTRGSMEAVGAVEPLEPRVVATQPGTAIVVWVDRRNGTPDIYAKEMAPGPEGPPATTGVDDSDLHFAISGVAPNPSRGASHVTIQLSHASPGKLDVIDLTGRVREQHAVPIGRSTVTINAAARMPTGVYWLRVTQGANVATRPFVIAR